MNFDYGEDCPGPYGDLDYMYLEQKVSFKDTYA